MQQHAHPLVSPDTMASQARCHPEAPGRGDPQAEPGGSSSPGMAGLQGGDASQGDNSPGRRTTQENGPGFGTRNLASLNIANAVNPNKTSLAQLFHILTKLSIEPETTRYHPPPRPPHMKGIFCKNLFLKDRRARFYLLILDEGKGVDLKKFKIAVHAHRNLSFGSSDDLEKTLALTPGSLTPFGLINDPQNTVRFVVDEALLKKAQSSKALLNFHPFVDFLTTLVSFEDLAKFVEFTGHKMELVSL